MRIRNTIAMSLWFKFILFVMCGGILYIHYALGIDYFNSTLSADQQISAVESALDVDARNDLGLTGLMFAAIYGEKELASALIKRGSHLELTSPDERQTALHYATNNLRAMDSAAVGYQLIDAYASTRAVNNLGNSPLQLVISTDVLEDRQKMVDALMKNGANINAQNAQGDTLLHLAVNMQAYNWLPSLLQKYGSIMNRTLKNKKGLTAREYAEQLGFGDMLPMLDQVQPLIASAERDSQGLTGLMLAIMGDDKKIVGKYAKDKKAINLLSNDEYQNSALHVALMNEDIDALSVLLANNANLTIKNAKGELPIHYIVRVFDPAKKVKALDMILKSAPSSLLAQNKRGDTVVHYLVQYDDQVSFEYLYKNYKSLLQKALAIKNKSLETPVALANRLSRPVILKAIQAMASAPRKKR